MCSTFIVVQTINTTCGLPVLWFAMSLHLSLGNLERVVLCGVKIYLIAILHCLEDLTVIK